MVGYGTGSNAWKRNAWIVIAGVALVLAPMPSAAAAPLANPGFETGNFSGWGVSIPPGAFAGVLTSYTGTTTGFVATPFNGRFFAVLKTDGPGSQTRVFQTVGLAAGETLGGAAFFKAEDYCPYNDASQVLVIRAGGPTSVVFSSSVCSVGNYGYTGWTPWSFTAPVAGTYLVEARISNSGDSGLDSFMGIDSGAPLDTTPPVTSTTVSPPANGNGWHNTDVVVGFAATDAGSGVKDIIYQVDGGAPVTVPGAATSVVLTSEGAHQVAYYATDNAGNSAAVKTVSVKIDTTAPACEATPDVQSLWPPNHKMVAINVAVGASDGGSGVSAWSLAGVSSDEPDNGEGDGDTTDDIQGWDAGTGDASGLLRAERMGGGDGRVYTLSYSVEDTAGNAATCSGSVVVPHSKGA